VCDGAGCAAGIQGTGYLDRVEWGWTGDGIPYETFKAMDGARLSLQESRGPLAISPSSVNTYIRRIYEKLHVHSRAQAVLRDPYRLGPVSPSLS